VRILIIEDDAPLRALLRRGLSGDGHVVDAIRTVAIAMNT
jgi:DNA-binding response OmpR family regulator